MKLLIAAYLLLECVNAWLIFRAPHGYEDRRGFHLGEEPEDKR